MEAMHEARRLGTGCGGEEGARRTGAWLPSYLPVRAKLELQELVTKLPFVTDIESQIEVGAVLSGSHRGSNFAPAPLLVSRTLYDEQSCCYALCNMRSCKKPIQCLSPLDTEEANFLLGPSFLQEAPSSVILQSCTAQGVIGINLRAFKRGGGWGSSLTSQSIQC